MLVSLSVPPGSPGPGPAATGLAMTEALGPPAAAGGRGGPALSLTQ